MNDSQCRITLLVVVYDNTDRKKVIDLVETLMLFYHLSVNTEKVFYSSVNGGCDPILNEFFIDLFHDLFNKISFSRLDSFKLLT